VQFKGHLAFAAAQGVRNTGRILISQDYSLVRRVRPANFAVLLITSAQLKKS
jgi:uncharacterized protein with PIN domain